MGDAFELTCNLWDRQMISLHAALPAAHNEMPMFSARHKENALNRGVFLVYSACGA